MPDRLQLRHSAVFVVTMNSTTTSTAVAPAAVTEWPSSGRRHKVDLSGVNQVRICCRVSSAWGGASVKVAIQYSADEASWFYFSATASGSAPSVGDYVSGAAIGTIVSAWVTLPAAARADVFLRGVTLDGDNTTAGAGGTLALNTR